MQFKLILCFRSIVCPTGAAEQVRFEWTDSRFWACCSIVVTPTSDLAQCIHVGEQFLRAQTCELIGDYSEKKERVAQDWRFNILLSQIGRAHQSNATRIQFVQVTLTQCVAQHFRRFSGFHDPIHSVNSLLTLSDDLYSCFQGQKFFLLWSLDLSILLFFFRLYCCCESNFRIWNQLIDCQHWLDFLDFSLAFRLANVWLAGGRNLYSTTFDWIWLIKSFV